MKKIIPFILLIMLLMQACGGNTSATEAVELPVETAAATAEVVEEQPAAEPIVHTVIPPGGTKARAYAHDNENSTNFENKNVRFGDEFQKNRFERPFTSNDMAYLPDLDIMDFGITSDEQFFYITIILAGLADGQDAPTGIYGVEIDRDADGRSELMLGALPGFSSTFTAENVVVLADLNGDMGETTINRPDLGFEGNGYEGIIFDLSQNIHPDDPDLAWVRTGFTEAGGETRPIIEIAYRKWIFKGGGEKFMWSVFSLSADQGLDVTKFYAHDTISEIEAGSPDKGNPNYPVKALAAMDNTCRVPLGFEASGAEPLGCAVKVDVPVIEEIAELGGDGGSGDGGGGNGVSVLPEFCNAFVEICDRVPPAQPPAGPPVFFAIGDPID